MPNWKKVVVSGSDAILSSVTSSFTGSLTGALIGTSSWATNTVSASFASTSSFVNPLRQNVIISGSVFVSSSILGSGSTYNTTIDLQSATISTNGTASIAYGVKYLFDNKNVRSIVWDARQLLDNSQSLSVNYNSRTLNSGSTTILDWSSGTGSLIGTSSWAQSASNAISSSRATSSSYALSASYAPGGGSAFPYVGTAVITGSLIVSGANGGIDTSLNSPALLSGDGNAAVVFGTNRKWLNDANSTTVVDWEVQSLSDSLAALSIDWTNRILYEPGGIEALNYSNSASVSSQLYYNNIIPAQVQRELANNPTYAGQTIQASIDVGVTDFQLVFLDTDGIWKATKATVANGAAKMLGICVDQAGGYVLIEGDVGVSDDNSQGAYVIGADHGLPVYVSATTGVMTVTAPSGTGELVRIVGHIYYQSTTDANWWTMKFRPSNDWYEI